MWAKQKTFFMQHKKKNAYALNSVGFTTVERNCSLKFCNSNVTKQMQTNFCPNYNGKLLPQKHTKMETNAPFEI